MEFPTIFSITEDEIDLNDLLARITLTSTGAAAIFTGMVRGETMRADAHATVYLEYEAYIPMAEAKMKQVAAEIRAKWPIIEGIAIIQRIGKLYPKTPTVLIACTSAALGRVSTSKSCSSFSMASSRLISALKVGLI